MHFDSRPEENARSGLAFLLLLVVAVLGYLLGCAGGG